MMIWNWDKMFVYIICIELFYIATNDQFSDSLKVLTVNNL